MKNEKKQEGWMLWFWVIAVIFVFSQGYKSQVQILSTGEVKTLLYKIPKSPGEITQAHIDGKDISVRVLGTVWCSNEYLAGL